MKDSEENAIGCIIVGIIFLYFIMGAERFLTLLGLIVFGITAYMVLIWQSNSKEINYAEEEYQKIKDVVEINLFDKAADVGLYDPLMQKCHFDVFVSIIMSKYGLALKNDRRRLLNKDSYGRVAEENIGAWKWHLLDVVDTCQLDSHDDHIRQLFKQLIVWEFDNDSLVFDDNQEWVETSEISNFNVTDILKSKRGSNDLVAMPLLHYRDTVFTIFEGSLISRISDSFNMNMTGLEYEAYCADIFRKEGWDVVELPATGDHGADLLASCNNISVAVQCKKYAKPIGNTAVQEVVASAKHYKTKFAVVVTNASYTKGAQILAKSNGVILLHHDDLIEVNSIFRS